MKGCIEKTKIIFCLRESPALSSPVQPSQEKNNRGREGCAKIYERLKLTIMKSIHE